MILRFLIIWCFVHKISHVTPIKNVTDHDGIHRLVCCQSWFL